MLNDRSDAPAQPLPGTAARPFASHEVIPGRADRGLIVVCDHARNALPAGYGTLGLPAGEFERHIAYDIGVEAVTRRLCQRLGVPGVLAGFSRLLIDPNRGLDDPTLIMQLSDGAVVPGNAGLSAAERARRIELYYRPYHDAIDGLIAAAEASGRAPAILSIHSFTPTWRGVPRPWHAAVLWNRDARFAGPLIAALSADPDLVIGDNEPYAGGLEGDTLDAHATARGLPDALVEIRQDLIADAAGATEWADRLATVVPGIIDGLGPKTAKPDETEREDAAWTSEPEPNSKRPPSGGWSSISESAPTSRTST